LEKNPQEIDLFAVGGMPVAAAGAIGGAAVYRQDAG
jgi:hypothetical protein